jgi:hypothetical protein
LHTPKEVTISSFALSIGTEAKRPGVRILPKPSTARGGGDTGLIETETGLGTLTHMAAVIQYSKTKAFWERPVVDLGAEWPERGAKYCFS